VLSLDLLGDLHLELEIKDMLGGGGGRSLSICIEALTAWSELDRIIGGGGGNISSEKLR
jgi:hypothetical protein